MYSSLSESTDQEVESATPNHMTNVPWSLCPPDVSLSSCYSQYIALLRRSEKQDRDDAPDGNAVDKRGALIDGDWKVLCPEYKSKADCLASYLSLLSVTTPRSVKYKYKFKKYKRNPNRSQLSWRICSNAIEKVNCFENYISLWLHHVSGRNSMKSSHTALMGAYRRNRMNTFVGKRGQSASGSGLRLLSFPEISKLCPPETDLSLCYEAYVRLMQPESASRELEMESELKKQLIKMENASENLNSSEESSTSEELSALGDDPERKCDTRCQLHSLSERIAKFESNTISNDAQRMNKRPADNLCPSGMKLVTCFEKYLRQMIRAGSSSNSLAGRYIGRVTRTPGDQTEVNVFDAHAWQLLSKPKTRWWNFSWENFSIVVWYNKYACIYTFRFKGLSFVRMLDVIKAAVDHFLNNVVLYAPH